MLGLRRQESALHIGRKNGAMNAFIVEVENRPGTMAQVTEAVAAKGVNILVLTVGYDDRGAVAFVCNDEGGARSGLDEAGLSFRESPVVLIGMEDKPGQSAAAARKLADAGSTSSSGCRWTHPRTASPWRSASTTRGPLGRPSPTTSSTGPTPSERASHRRARP
jgi:hypothetical protein